MLVHRNAVGVDPGFTPFHFRSEAAEMIRPPCEETPCGALP